MERLCCRSMTWCAASLSLILAATPPGARRFNLEPVVLAVTGAVGIGFSAWRFQQADLVYLKLKDVPTTASSQAEAVEFLARGRALAFTGNSETALAGTLALMGGALIITGILWFLLEGRETTDWLSARFQERSP